MALSPGSVSVAPDGTVSGSGFARELYASESAAAASTLEGSVADVVAPTVAALRASIDGAVQAYATSRAAARERLAARVPAYAWMVPRYAAELVAFDKETDAKLKAKSAEAAAAITDQRAKLTASNIASRQGAATKSNAGAADLVTLLTPELAALAASTADVAANLASHASSPTAHAAAIAAAIAGAVQGGAAALSSGTATISANITLSSRIVAMRRNALGTAGVELRCATADRTVGAPGTFTVRSYDAAGVAAGADTSTFDWVVYG